MPIAILMGVAGCGKTTVGLELARQLQWDFLDADDFHPPANIAKIARNEPLTDTDRTPWLATLQQRLQRYHQQRASAVLACSALKHRYRQYLREECPEARMVYLKGTYSLIRDRLEQRSNHFATAGLLDSQFADLEEPSSNEYHQTLTVDINRPLEEIVSEIRHYLQA